MRSTVVDIGDVRAARGETRRHAGRCNHLNQVFDKDERRVWCTDCESEVEPFDAYLKLVENMTGAVEKLKRREQAVKEAESFQARSRAVKALDQVWRSKNMTPLCPCCDKGLLPEDFANGVQSQMDRNLARKMRRRGDA
ncbi:hypothetical protein [Vreelandella titanicae]|uniref:hypothetical protein n=1 Tax=Vreelandella titanicae TaxID=664683 RepID=UPI004043FC8D